MIKVCPKCNKEFIVKPSHSWRVNCSLKCYGKEKRVVLRNCLCCKNDFQTREWKIRAGRGKYCSKECSWLGKIGKPSWNKGSHNVKYQGKSHYNWKGGITPINAAIRASSEMTNLKNKILKNQNYTCRICGQVGRKLQVDHLRPFSLFPEDRFNPKNLNVLCINCHKLKTGLDLKFIRGVWPVDLLDEITQYVHK